MVKRRCVVLSLHGIRAARAGLIAKGERELLQFHVWQYSQWAYSVFQASATKVLHETVADKASLWHSQTKNAVVPSHAIYFTL